MKQTKKTITESWEEEFDNKLVDWNSPRFFADNVTTDTVKKYIKQLLAKQRQAVIEECKKENV